MSETFNRTDKLTAVGGFGRYSITFQRTDNSSDASKLQVEETHTINVRTNIVHAEYLLVMVPSHHLQHDDVTGRLHAEAIA